MADVKTLTDVELTELWLSEVKGYPDNKAMIQAIDYEMRERGQERVRTAWHIVSAMREAAKAPECSVCGDCKPVAAYGGWCCLKSLGAAAKEVA